jgi:hypothetical protein
VFATKFHDVDFKSFFGDLRLQETQVYYASFSLCFETFDVCILLYELCFELGFLFVVGELHVGLNVICHLG